MSYVLFVLMIMLMIIVFVVPLSQKLKLDPILGYILAGLLLTPTERFFPYSLHDILSVSHMGIALMMLLVGLEISPRALREEKKIFLVWGPVQVVTMAFLFFLLSIPFFSFSLTGGILVFIGLSFSSTAFAVKALHDEQLISYPIGKAALSFLLFQDIIAVLILSLIPFLEAEFDLSTSWKPFGLLGGKILFVLFILFVSQKPLKKIFQLAINTNMFEVFSATSLSFILGVIILMDRLGLSWELGAFLAGVSLSQSDYVSAIRTHLYPYKAILMAFFFIALGMRLDPLAFMQHWTFLLLLTAVIVAVKIFVFKALSPFIDLKNNTSLRFDILMAQGSEFAFILFTKAEEGRLLSGEISQLLSISIILSMLATPILLRLYPQK